MRKVALLPQQDRRDLFLETAARLGIGPAVIEKDFWLCIVLEILFTDSAYAPHLVFKGGTSLSKAYGLIQRFSEDIDLVLDWTLLGFGKDQGTPVRDFPSKTQQDRFNKEVNRRAGEFIQARLQPEIEPLFQRTGTGLLSAIDPGDPQIVNIRYPASFSQSYIRPDVRLEIGPLASWVPSAPRPIQPYAADAFPRLFGNPSCTVITIAAERTFWEKATILHKEAQRPGVLPERHSRHYYDLHKLAHSPVRDRALAGLSLLGDVVAFKQRFYPSRWARYDLAVPGTFKLLPADAAKIENLGRDYANMQVMLFGGPPTFESILETLRDLERDINVARPRVG